MDLNEAMAQASQRMEATSPPAGGRRSRSDKGAVRLTGEAMDRVRHLLLTQEKPPMTAVLQDLARTLPQGSCPSRATMYHLLHRIPMPPCRVSSLPSPVQDALYNLEGDSRVPPHQVVFYCFHHGDLRAVSHAAGMPWLALHQAGRLPGWRPRSRGLFNAVCRFRGICR